VGQWEWQRGEFKLPTAEFAKVRSAVEAADKGHKERVFEETQILWKGLTGKQKSNPVEYHAFFSTDNSPEGSVHEDALQEMRAAAYRAGKPTRVLKTDMNYPTNKTLRFSADDLDITFDRDTSSVSYSIEEGRGTIDRAEKTEIFKALNAAISSMRWTRGTGGRTWYDSEYGSEGRGEHGYAHDPTNNAYGPIGAANWPMQSRPWTDPKGERYSVQLVAGRGGLQHRVQKGAPASTGGQFGSRSRSESGVSLRY
jgi:hypothetical protein